MNLMTVLEITKAVGLILIGIGIIGYAVGKIIELRNGRKEI